MISAPIAKAIDFPSQRQAQRPARPNAWLTHISQRLQLRQQADAACPIH